MAGTNLTLVGSAGTREGFECKVYTDRDRNLIMGDPRGPMTSMNTVQREELIDVLVAHRTAELPPLPPIETFQADPNSAHAPTPTGDVEPIHRK